MSGLAVIGRDDQGLAFTGNYLTGLSGRVFWRAVFKSNGRLVDIRHGEIETDPSDDALDMVKQVLNAMAHSWRPGI